MQPSCRKARRFKELACQPILANSATYHAFRVSFHVALDPTTKTGQSETTHPAQKSQRFGVVSCNSTAMELISPSLLKTSDQAYRSGTANSGLRRVSAPRYCAPNAK